MQSIILHMTNHHHLYNLNLTFLMTLVMVMVRRCRIIFSLIPYLKEDEYVLVLPHVIVVT